jgi:L-fuculose-phosphate aldolase
MSAKLYRQLIETARAMNTSGINQGTSGNLSVRHGDGMLITPTGMDYVGLSPGDIVFVNRMGQPQSEGIPSSEWRFHYAIYANRPNTQAVLHAHPENCATLASLRKPIPAFHYMVAVAGGRDIPCAEYATFGTEELSNNVLEALTGRKACLMANHGLVCLDQSLEKVLALAIEIENLAKIYMRALSIGEPTILDDEEMDRVIEKFQTYGDPNAT